MTAAVAAPAAVLTPEELFDANQRLVEWAANKLLASSLAGDDRDDVVQDGLMGLWHACQRFDAGRGWQFSTYGYRCVTGYMFHGHRLRVGKNERRGRWVDIVSFDATIGDGGATFADVLADDEPAFDDQVNAAIMCGAAFDALPAEKDRVLLATLAFERGSFGGTAARIGMSRQGALLRRDKALRRVRSALGVAS